MTLARLAPGEPEVFSVLFRRHARDVHRFAWRRTRNDMIADDITAVTFEKCWRSLPGLRLRGSSLRPWLFRIAANEIASHFRSESRRDAREHLASIRDDALQSPVDASDDVGGDAELVAAMSQLGERHQLVVSLRFLADLTTEEIAEAMGIRRGHVAVLQHRALASLRRNLEGAADDR